ncbi:MAG: hypothetical protein ACAH95_18200 [Fimbriimonas sp.]
MQNVTISMDDRLLALARDYAKRHGTTFNQFVRDLVSSKVCPEPGYSFMAMVEESKRLGLRSVDGPLSRDEAHERG